MKIRNLKSIRESGYYANYYCFIRDCFVFAFGESDFPKRRKILDGTFLQTKRKEKIKNKR